MTLNSLSFFHYRVTPCIFTIIFKQLIRTCWYFQRLCKGERHIMRVPREELSPVPVSRFPFPFLCSHSPKRFREFPFFVPVLENPGELFCVLCVGKSADYWSTASTIIHSTTLNLTEAHTQTRKANKLLFIRSNLAALRELFWPSLELPTEKYSWFWLNFCTIIKTTIY